MMRKPKENEGEQELLEEIEEARRKMGLFVRITSDKFEQDHPVSVKEQEEKLNNLLKKVTRLNVN